MQRIMKRPLAVLLSVLMALSVFGGLGFGARAEGGQIKQLARGVMFYIGDYCRADTKGTYVKVAGSAAAVRATNSNYSLADLPDSSLMAVQAPEYDSRDQQWIFTHLIPYMYITYTNDGVLYYHADYNTYRFPASPTNLPPIGVRVVDDGYADGSQNKPYKLELVYPSWTYTVSEDRITATCDAKYGVSPQTVTVRAQSRDYIPNTPYAAEVTLSDGWTAENLLNAPTVRYYEYVDGERTYLYAPPTNAGSYCVRVSVGDAVLQKDFSIRRLGTGYLSLNRPVSPDDPDQFPGLVWDEYNYEYYQTYTGQPQQLLQFGSTFWNNNDCIVRQPGTGDHVTVYACMIKSGGDDAFFNPGDYWQPVVSYTKTLREIYRVGSDETYFYDYSDIKTLDDLAADHGVPVVGEPLYTNTPSQYYAYRECSGWFICEDEDGNPSLSRVQGLNAGAYAVYFFVDGGRNFDSFWFRSDGYIRPADASAAVVPTGVTAVYGQNVASVELPDNWEWGYEALFTEEIDKQYGGYMTVDRKVGEVGSHTFTACNKNYWPDEFEVTVTVEKANPKTYTPYANAVYGQTLSEVSLGNGYSWEDGIRPVGDVGTYRSIGGVIYTPEDTAHYNVITGLSARVRVDPKPLTITANPVGKTVGAADPELTYTVEGLVAGDTLTGALEREAGEEPGTYTISLGTLSAGDKYDIQFTASTFTIAAEAEPKDQQSVTIGDQISVNFLLDLDKRVDVQSVVIAYIDPQTGDVQQSAEYTEFGSFEKQGDLYKIPAEVAPAQLSETVRVTILYGEDDVQTLSTSVAEYCETLIAGDQTAAVKALARATLEYGQAANDFFPCDKAEFSTTENAEAAVESVKKLPSTLSVQTDKITGAAFMVLTKPEFRFYTEGLTEAEAVQLNNKIDASGGAKVRFVKNGDDILVEVTGVEAADMAKAITVTVDGKAWVTFSGNDFARLLANYEPTAVLGAALYNYGDAAAKCFNP